MAACLLARFRCAECLLARGAERAPCRAPAPCLRGGRGRPDPLEDEAQGHARRECRAAEEGRLQVGAGFPWRTLARAPRAWGGAAASEASRRGMHAPVMVRRKTAARKPRRTEETGTLENGATSPECAACW